jgi:glutamate dehydrogenase/leucine dehydrogenase
MAPYQWYCVSFTACDTAFGVIRAMQTRCNRVYSSDNLEGKIIAVQGPGAVGHNISNETLDRVKHKILCRTANNQLKEERHGELLEQKGIGSHPITLPRPVGPFMKRIGWASVWSITNEAGKRYLASIRTWSGS